jgi:hypothetical protein
MPAGRSGDLPEAFRLSAGAVAPEAIDRRLELELRVAEARAEVA